MPEIERLVARYADAAERCKKAGFDGVQIHAANGYLMSQFLTPYTNRRTDAYGGSVEGRTRLLREVIRAIKSRLGADFPVIVKMNGSDYLPLRPGLETDELAEIAVILERGGADAIEVSVGHYESGFPMVRGTFARCLRNMVQGSMSHLRILPPLVLPAVLADPRGGVRSDLDASRRLQPAAIHASSSRRCRSR